MRQIFSAPGKAWHLQEVKFLPLRGVAYQGESSLERVSVTGFVKRRQSEMQAETPRREVIEPR